jgi:2-C-methyl-D-erythritol 4-phosphate cytidylyltransferase
MNSAIIVAAGKGTRMGAGVDKLFLEVAGRPIVAHTWQRFNDAPCIDEIILVVRDGTQSAFAELAQQFKLTKRHRFVVGGAERQDSVWNGLAALSPSATLVAIQDGARPCTTLDLIAATLDAARETGAAVAAQLVTDTIMAKPSRAMWIVPGFAPCKRHKRFAWRSSAVRSLKSAPAISTSRTTPLRVS